MTAIPQPPRKSRTPSQFLSRSERFEAEELLGRVKLFTYDDVVEYARTRVIEMPNESYVNIGLDESDDIPRSEARAHSFSAVSGTLHQTKAGDYIVDRANEKTYDLAFSFAGEDRGIARELAEAMQAKGFRVFYDEYEQASLWGKDLYVHLSEVYGKRARYCVMIISEHYASKLWTNHERRAAQERAFRDRKEYILPIRLDDTPIDGVLSTTGYLDLRSVGIEHVVSSLVLKLGEP